MAVYRFRVTLDDYDDVYREIDIKSTQHFEDFHNIILQSFGFDNKHEASFYKSDDHWHKGEEITLRLLENKNTNYDDSDSPKTVAVKQMNKCKLSSLIDDPHQKFVYEYDFEAEWMFTVELVKIVPDDEKSSYPKCVKSVGEAPKQYKNTTPVVVIEDEDADDKLDDKFIDEVAYVSASTDEDTSLLEGEEGDAETEEESDSEFSGDIDEEEGSDFSEDGAADDSFNED